MSETDPSERAESAPQEQDRSDLAQPEQNMPDAEPAQAAAPHPEDACADGEQNADVDDQDNSFETQAEEDFAKDAQGSRSQGNKGGGKKGKPGKSKSTEGNNSLLDAIPWDQPLALIKFGRMRRVELFAYSLDRTPKRGEKVVIRTDRGVELGEIITPLAQLNDGSVVPQVSEDLGQGCEKCEKCTSSPDSPDTGDDDKPDPKTEANSQAVINSDENTARPDDQKEESANAEKSTSDGDETVPAAFEVDPQLCFTDCGKMKEIIAGGSPDYSYHRNNRILRMASAQDISDQHHLDINAVEKQKFCRSKAREQNLNMRLAGVEHLLGGERIVFYFTSESRVDFRELVRELASQYRTRIEMRQIGARDEARIAADYERCGQQCCCQVFLGELQPVSIRMAKVQKATLDPTKISGRCNRLMCCLRYEDSTYEQLRRKLPRRNTWITTTELVGKVIDSQIITQLVRVVEPNGAVSFVNNDDIVDRNLNEQPAAPAPKPEGADAGETPDSEYEIDPRFYSRGDEPGSGDNADKQPADDQPGLTRQADQDNAEPGSPNGNNRSRRNNNRTGNKNSRRRRRPRKGSGDKPSQNSANSGGRDSSNQKKNSGQNNPKRRRRRRKPRGGSKGGDSPNKSE